VATYSLPDTRFLNPDSVSQDPLHTEEVVEIKPDEEAGHSSPALYQERHPTGAGKVETTKKTLISRFGVNQFSYSTMIAYSYTNYAECHHLNLTKKLKFCTKEKFFSKILKLSRILFSRNLLRLIRDSYSRCRE
jgi:hypothetical protein